MKLKSLVLAACLVSPLALTGCSDIYPPKADIDAIMALGPDYDGDTMPVVWDGFPDNKAMQAYYPKKAEKASTPGVVRLICDWDDQGRITDCQVMAEKPAGEGFGEASVALLKRYGHLKPRDAGASMHAGSGIQVVIQWAGGGVTLF